jgi:hypothetical protein
MSPPSIERVEGGTGFQISRNLPLQSLLFHLLPRPSRDWGRGSRWNKGDPDVWPQGNVPEGISNAERTARKNP